MKNVISKIFSGKDDRYGALIAFGIVALIALGCSCGDKFDLSNIAKNDNTSRTASNDTPPFGGDEDNSEMPDDRVLKTMIKATTAEFANAISTEQFSTLYSNASSDFQSTYTEEEVKTVFKPFIDKKRMVVPILNKAVPMEPEFSHAPSIRTEQGLTILVANGKFATKPFPTNFEYEYVKRAGQWKMLKLIVKIQ